jgi:hypothetical protein
MDLFYGLALKYVRWTEMITWEIPMFIYMFYIIIFIIFKLRKTSSQTNFNLYSRVSSKVLKHIRGSLISDLDLGF